jgi:hypothetical protein
MGDNKHRGLKQGLDEMTKGASQSNFERYIVAVAEDKRISSEDKDWALGYLRQIYWERWKE